MNLKKIIIVVIILSIVFSYLFLFNLKASQVTHDDLIEFSHSGFIDSTLLSETEKRVVSNQQFELYINETTSHFKILDKTTQTFWYSNPETQDPWQLNPEKLITNTALNRQKSTLEITYFNEAGSQSIINNYERSIYHPRSVLNDEGLRTFKIKYLSDGFQVLYQIEDLEIDYLYFPKYLPKEVLEEMEDYDTLIQYAYTSFDQDKNAYEIANYESISRQVRTRLYAVFYQKLGYTRERSIDENASFGYHDQYEKAAFEIAIEVRLTDTGIKASIINESIKEPSHSKIARIVFLPLFGTAVSEVDNKDTNGYIVLPDGSGAVINFNNGKHYQNPYRKKLYGADLALLSYKMPEQQEAITMPFYGMVKEESGFAAIITSGDAMATLNADVSGRIDSYNKVFVTFDLREVESVTIGTGYNRYGVDVWTRQKVVTDFTIEYTFLNSDDANYAGIAQVFRNYLIDRLGMVSKDQTTSTVLTTEFVGAYNEKQFFLGVPYDKIKSLTTFKEAEKIINTFIEHDINQINVMYAGVSNGGLSSSLSDRFNVENAIGGQKGFNQFVSFLDDEHMMLYPTIQLMTATSYHKAFDKQRYTANRIKGSLSRMFTYHFPSKLPYSETPFDYSDDPYIVNPLYYEAIYKKLNKSYAHDALYLSLMGSALSGHYERNKPVYRHDAKNLQIKTLENVSQSIMFSNPLAFAIPYAHTIVDLPMQTTLYGIIDYPIPLIHLVLSGLIDYSTQSLNLNQTRGSRYNFLKAIETGSNLKYTLSYDDSRALIYTEYNHYMSTHYENWMEQIVEYMQILDQLGIHKGRLISHERLLGNVYRVTYSHGLSLILNYNLNPVDILGHTIDSLDYVIVEV